MADPSSREIVLEAARSRAALELAFGGDERFVGVARQCGYRAGFTTDRGLSVLGQDVLRLPRVEAVGGWSLDAFIEVVRGV